jgi:hypothetical protein
MGATGVSQHPRTPAPAARRTNGVNVLAYNFPLLGAFLTMMWFFIWILWLILVFRVVMDIFRSDDLGGVGKTIWLLVVLFMPYLGVFIYVIARGKDMGARDLAQARAQEEAFRAYVQEAATTGGSSVDQLAKLADLRDRGVIDETEFQAQKAKLLA